MLSCLAVSASVLPLVWESGFPNAGTWAKFRAQSFWADGKPRGQAATLWVQCFFLESQILWRNPTSHPGQSPPTTKVPFAESSCWTFPVMGSFLTCKVALASILNWCKLLYGVLWVEPKSTWWCLPMLGTSLLHSIQLTLFFFIVQIIHTESISKYRENNILSNIFTTSRNAIVNILICV